MGLVTPAETGLAEVSITDVWAVLVRPTVWGRGLTAMRTPNSPGVGSGSFGGGSMGGVRLRLL